MNLVLSTLPLEGPGAAPVEVVERKGLGHPDTICDALAERLSVALGRWYLEHAGAILHHNVDKVLLRGGASRPAFGGGEVVEPIEIYFAGRATAAFGGAVVPVAELALEATRAWFGESFHALDPERHVRVQSLVRPGSSDLTELFARSAPAGRPSNDTSCGVGWAPHTPLEQVVLAVDRALIGGVPRDERRAVGEDLKLMAVRRHDRIRLTVACAFVDRFVGSMADYAEARRLVGARARQAAAGIVGLPIDVEVNTADDLARGSVYLTVTGTSAEAGDDGETGRGNRHNGLITPHRPMTLEAVAGKNPVTHVGKLYNLSATRIAEALVGELVGVREAQCWLVSQIGRAIEDPQIVEVRLRCDGGQSAETRAGEVEVVVGRELAALGSLWQGIVKGERPLW